MLRHVQYTCHWYKEDIVLKNKKGNKRIFYNPYPIVNKAGYSLKVNFELKLTIEKF